jgi:hypothetical protein
MLYAVIACQQALMVIRWNESLLWWNTISNICPETFVFPNMKCLSLHAWCCLQLSCKLNLDHTVYTIFQNIRYSSKHLKAVFSKQNISCFEIRWPRLIRSIDVFFMHNASAVDIYIAQWKHINYGIWLMIISIPDIVLSSFPAKWFMDNFSYPFKEPDTTCSYAVIACEQALKVKREPALVKYNFEYLPRNVCFSKYEMSFLTWCCLQLSCKLNLDRTVYTTFQNIRYSSKHLNV